MILFDSLPGFKPFLGSASYSAAVSLHLLRFSLCLLFHHGRMSLSNAAGFLRSEARDIGNLARFLAQKAPSLEVLVFAGQSLRQTPCRQQGTWLFLIDSTFIGHQGHSAQNTFSCGNTQARPRKSQRKQKRHHRRSCHGFVFGLLLRPDGVRIPCWLPYHTRDYCALLRLPYLTQAELAAQLIRDLIVPDAVRVVVAGDTAFEAESIRRVCAARGWQWVMPLNPERVLAGEKPRRKVRSLLQDLNAGSFAPIRLELSSDGHVQQRRAASCRRKSLKKGRTYWVHSRIAEVHSVGRVTLLFSNQQPLQEGQKVKADKILLSNATEASVAEVLGWYGLRWQIELFFKEMKSDLKMSQYKFKRFDQVVGWVTVCVLSFTYLEWRRAVKLAQEDLDAQEQERWEQARTHGLKENLRQELEQEELHKMYDWTQSPEGLRQLQDYLRAALQPQGRTHTAA
jgi:hypothetical protein